MIGMEKQQIAVRLGIIRDGIRGLAKKMAAGKVAGGRLNLEVARIIALAKKSGLGDSDPCVVCAGGKG